MMISNYTQRYVAHRVHPWWKFWRIRKFTVRRLRQPHYNLGPYTLKNAIRFTTVLNDRS